MKKRLDVLLTEKGLAPSREKARALIMEGRVFTGSERLDKPGMSIDAETALFVKGDPLPYVSRGGLKLEKALRVFPISLKGSLCLDIGASTGGFTDCMLQNGAEKVFAVDTGYGQLAYSLRTDERVVSMERMNFRYAKPEDFPEAFDFASADVSFISLDKILAPAYACLKEEGEMVCLIKPQFEAGREKVGKNGVVKEKATHLQVIEKVLREALETGFLPAGMDFSPIRGPKGNIEYLLYLQKAGNQPADGAGGRESLPEAGDLVDRAHEYFDRHEHSQG